jgi:3-deoxy-manno-octulosonate cytidylyltransferase (CMP-KDO synthetase)
MNTGQDFIGIIPARYESSRFPGKPLADIMGRPMFWHVYTRAVKCRLLSQVFLATDHDLIFNTARNLNIPVVMTSSDHQSGSDRVLEAARLVNAARDSVIVNIQGDEPLLEPEMLDQLLTPFVSAAEVNVSTLARSIPREEATSRNVVKVVFSTSGRALYFSRSIIPWSEHETSCHAHIGIYAYRMKYLEQFSALKQSSLEKAEKLEQLRLLEADIPISVVVTRHISHGVDTPEDIINVTKIMREQK